MFVSTIHEIHFPRMDQAINTHITYLRESADAFQSLKQIFDGHFHDIYARFRLVKRQNFKLILIFSTEDIEKIENLIDMSFESAINLEQIEMLRIAVFNIVDSEIYDPNELLKEGQS